MRKAPQISERNDKPMENGGVHGLFPEKPTRAVVREKACTRPGDPRHAGQATPVCSRPWQVWPSEALELADVLGGRLMGTASWEGSLASLRPLGMTPGGILLGTRRETLPLGARGWNAQRAIECQQQPGTP